MQNDAANIHCPNTTCEAPNPETNNFCEKCRTPLPRRYLWAVYEGKLAYKPGEILADRYTIKENRIFLDTKPGLPPATPEEVPEAIAAYLRLFPYRVHVPQVYGQLPRSQTRLATDIWLLEQAPIAVEDSKASESVKIELRPQLTSLWKKANGMRQLNWLWQIAQLWQPFDTEGVASSLLEPEQLRVEGQIVRLLQLQVDRKTTTLSGLGQMWSQWVASSEPSIAPFLERLCQQLIQGRVRNASQLVTILDRALVVGGRSQKRTYQIATGTDTGPSRRRNEDACYPVSGTFETPTTEPIAIVCDGIGGHEGGNVASASAIEAIRQRVLTLQSHPENLDPQTLTQSLEEAACIANDRISDRNNDEQRQGRQRMGTTLVMALGNAQELYITHVGDSRAYWITRNGCYQVTLDDDVASREVRLGYALYRDAVQQPAAGSLVQALGMNASGMLHPTVGRFVLDEDCLFLLCSDGLSDNDRVEQYWETELLPILNGEIDLPTAVSRLIGVGNTQNGHDNVTVGLVYCQVRENKQNDISSEALLAELDAVLSTWAESGDTAIALASTAETPADNPTVLQIPPPRPASPLPWLATIVILLLMLGGGGMLAYLFIPEIKQGLDPLIGRQPISTPEPAPITPSSPESPVPSTPVIPSLNVKSFIQIYTAATENGQNTPPVRLHETASATGTFTGIVTDGSILKVLDKTTTSDKITWLQLQVCSQGTVNSTALDPLPVNGKSPEPSPENRPITSPIVTLPLLQPGDKGWILETEVASLRLAKPTPNREQLKNCADPPTVSPTPTKTATPAPANSP